MFRSGAMRWLLFGIGFVVAVAIVAVSLYVYMQRQGAHLKASYQAVADKDALGEEVRMQSELLATTTEDRAALTSYIVDGSDGVVAFLSLVDQLADELGVSLTTTSLEVAKDKGVFSILTLHISAEGSEERMNHLLGGVETLPYKSRLQEVTLTRTRDPESGVALLRAQMVLDVSLMNYDQ